MTESKLVKRPVESPVARYQAMCRAIAEAHSIDEVKLIRDWAAALVAAARIAKNREATRQCLEIQIRAERRWGQLHIPARAGRPPENPSSDTRDFPTLAEMGVSYDESARRHKLAEMSDEKFEAALAAVDIPTAGAVLTHSHRTQGTGVNERYTPRQYIEAARRVLGEIDLDPASHPVAQNWIKARQFYTAEDDGLAREWHGRVWMNPPYSRDLIGPFIDKMVAEIEAGHVSAAVILTHSYTDTEWFHRIAPVMQAWCFTRGRIGFIDQFGEPLTSPPLGQVFLYYGPDIALFAAVFGRFGLVSRPLRENLNKG